MVISQLALCGPIFFYILFCCYISCFKINRILCTRVLLKITENSLSASHTDIKKCLFFLVLGFETMPETACHLISRISLARFSRGNICWILPHCPKCTEVGDSILLKNVLHAGGDVERFCWTLYW